MSSHPSLSKRPARRRDISSTVRRKELASAIAVFGVKTSNPCSNCKALDSDCMVDPRSGKCAGCIKHSRVCDLIVSRIEWEKLKKEHQKLKQQMDDIEATLQQLLARRSCLLQQWVDLEERAVRTISREADNIEMLERLEQDKETTLPMHGTNFFSGMECIGQDVLRMGLEGWDSMSGSSSNLLDR